MNHKGLPKQISRLELISLKKKALRKGLWLKIDKLKRAALEISIKVLNFVRSRELIRIFYEIYELVDSGYRLLRNAYKIGSKVAIIRAREAIKIGYSKVEDMIKSKEYKLFLGISYLNTPLSYRPII